MGSRNSALSPVFLGLRIGLHGLCVGLIALVVATAGSAGMPAGAVIICLAAVFLGTYAAGWLLSRNFDGARPRLGAAWVGVLGLEWVALAVVSPEAIYLVFPLFFLALHFLRGWRGPVSVAGATLVAIALFGMHRGFGVAGIVGPLIGAAVAVAIGLAYRSLDREATERERLINELRATRTQLAAAERAAGVQGERARLAREIHDTVSQSLSSIVMLLHAAERSGGVTGTGLDRLHQAREAAAQALAETRQFIDELSPPALREATLVEALGRLAVQTGDSSGIPVGVTIAGTPVPLPTQVETALLRIAQGALANAVQHARASRIDLTLSMLDSEVILDVVDDGVGFTAGPDQESTTDGRTSFGLQAMRERVAALGGSLTVESEPGRGTSIVAGFEVPG
ncbi:sensor histidine kinase [Cryobacterium cryoconiti]|uniref:Sensor histidine kinase n=1 Tax=Cryobacterium cryoconiti TaxID=1259239 RepID=A0A4Y8JTH8_9MICO|nr:sensor histidine kinase [Cryobacterium cryoconiti]